jgi:hypothetical protein
MCLTITKTKVRPGKRVYKLVTFTVYGTNIELFSPHFGYMWEPGKHVSDRETTFGKDFTNKLTPEEIELTEVEHGFHTYGNIKDIKNDLHCQQTYIVLNASKNERVCSGKYDNKVCHVFDELTLEKREHSRAIARAKRQIVLDSKFNS